MNIYISGPITGRSDEENEKAFNEAKLEIMKLGHVPVSPWDIGKVLPRSFTHSDYMDIDIEILRRCDAVVFIDGWEKSDGCQLEHAIVRSWQLSVDPEFPDIKVYYSIASILEADE